MFFQSLSIIYRQLKKKLATLIIISITASTMANYQLDSIHEVIKRHEKPKQLWHKKAMPRQQTIQIARVENTEHFNPFSANRKLSPDWSMIFDTLFASDPKRFGIYQPMIASDISSSNDKKTLYLTIHPDARFSNQQQIIADDVIASLEQAINKGPIEHQPLAEAHFQYQALSPKRLSIKASQPITFHKIIHIGSIPITEKKSLSSGSLPLNSGAYKLTLHKPKHYAILERNPDYWADQHLQQHKYQFSGIKFVYLKNRHTAFELFKRGEIDFRWEEYYENWQYLRQQQKSSPSLKLKEITHCRPAGMSGFAFNHQRWYLKEQPIRKALSSAFHFDNINKALFQNQYQRITSYFTNTPYQSKGIAHEQWSLEDADQLLIQHGWVIVDGKRIYSKTGERMTIKLLVNSAGNEKIANIYSANLKALGIDTHIEHAGSADYLYRLKQGDFDMAHFTISVPTLTHHELLKPFIANTDQHYSFSRLFNVQSAVIDAQITVIDDPSMSERRFQEMQTLDQKLLEEHLFIPFWRPANDRIAYWDRINGPKTAYTTRPRDHFKYWWPA